MMGLFRHGGNFSSLAHLASNDDCNNSDWFQNDCNYQYFCGYDHGESVMFEDLNADGYIVYLARNWDFLNDSTEVNWQLDAICQYHPPYPWGSDLSDWDSYWGHD